MTHPCERCASPGNRSRIRTVESATLGRTVRVCRFDDECRPALVDVTRQAILEVREVEGKQAVVTHLEEGGGHLRTRWKSEPMPLDQAIEEAGWRALCCAWRRGQGVVYRLRHGLNLDEAAPFDPSVVESGALRFNRTPSRTNVHVVGDKAGVFHEHLVDPPDRPPPVPQ